MDVATRADLTRRVEHAVAASVFPAYEALAAYLESLRSTATRNDGAWALPDGDAFYAFLLRRDGDRWLPALCCGALG
ncbi:MAG: DUF885 family protein [Oscillochloris sp.]|nr:DUF885 family protein [Oscillochloris sp.]